MPLLPGSPRPYLNKSAATVVRYHKLMRRTQSQMLPGYPQSRSNWLVLTAAGCLLLTASFACAVEVRDSQALLATLRAPKGPVGFCVHLGSGDGALTAELAAGGRLAVHALEADAKKVARARELLQTRALYGQAAVEPWANPFLPYADN